jgi:hypothetical protein
MTPRESDAADSSDEQDLINAEFEAMVSGLNLDQSSPRTYLDDLEDIDQSERAEIYTPPRVKRGLRGSIHHLLQSIKNWWKRPDSHDGDGAIV